MSRARMNLSPSLHIPCTRVCVCVCFVFYLVEGKKKPRPLSLFSNKKKQQISSFLIHLLFSPWTFQTWFPSLLLKSSSLLRIYESYILSTCLNPPRWIEELYHLDIICISICILTSPSFFLRSSCLFSSSFFPDASSASMSDRLLFFFVFVFFFFWNAPTREVIREIEAHRCGLVDVSAAAGKEYDKKPTASMEVQSMDFPICMSRPSKQSCSLPFLLQHIHTNSYL